MQSNIFDGCDYQQNRQNGREDLASYPGHEEEGTYSSRRQVRFVSGGNHLGRRSPYWKEKQGSYSKDNASGCFEKDY